MNKLFFLIFILVFGNFYNIYGEEKPVFPFSFVDIPDSISSLLINAYGNADCNAEHNVRNMTIRNDIEFQPGVYVFNGMGPHFKHMLFIFKKQIYIFKQAIEYATVYDMLIELSECRDSLKLNENEVSLYKSVIISAIKEKKLFLEDKSNRKVKIRKPLPKDVIAGTWFIQIKCLKKHKKKHWTRLYDSYLTLQHAHSNILLVKDSICENYNRKELQPTQYVTEQQDSLYKIVKLLKSKSKFYMIICRKIKKNEYELYYLSKKVF